MTETTPTARHDDLHAAIRRRILRLTLDLIPRPANAREISAAIKDLEKLLQVMEQRPE